MQQGCRRVAEEDSPEEVQTHLEEAWLEGREAELAPEAVGTTSFLLFFTSYKGATTIERREKLP